MAPQPTGDEKKRVEAAVYAFFEAGKNKDLPSLSGFHFPGGAFTKFDENPPYTRESAEEAFVYEQAAFANISDYSYQIENLRIDLVGDVAVATFYLTYRGMFVNDYSFEGSPVSSRARVTIVLSKMGGEWKFLHEHFSRFPDWDPGKGVDRAPRSTK